MLEINKVYLGDCLDVMHDIDACSIDMILCDLPYGTTSCRWDIIIPFDLLWIQYHRIIKKDGCIALFGSEPFSTYLRMSNIKAYKYDWIWNKKLAGNGILAKRQPLKIHELISIFNSRRYYPIKTKGRFRKKMGLKESAITGGASYCEATENDEYYPTSIQEFSMGNLRRGRLHPTQKPVELLEYLIKTYTLENELILDNCIGSGTTAVACIQTRRNFIGIDNDAHCVEMSNQRIAQERQGNKLL